MMAKSYISQRPAKMAQARVQRLSQKNQKKKKMRKYRRHAKVGVRRPKMRRQIGLTRVSRSK
jgi:hypothetical protein